MSDLSHPHVVTQADSTAFSRVISVRLKVNYLSKLKSLLDLDTLIWNPSDAIHIRRLTPFYGLVGSFSKSPRHDQSATNPAGVALPLHLTPHETIVLLILRHIEILACNERQGSHGSPSWDTPIRISDLRSLIAVGLPTDQLVPFRLRGLILATIHLLRAGTPSQPSILGPATNFGGDLVLYHEDPLISHSTTIIQLTTQDSYLLPRDVMAHARLACNTRKDLVYVTHVACAAEPCMSWLHSICDPTQLEDRLRTDLWWHTIKWTGW